MNLTSSKYYIPKSTILQNKQCHIAMQPHLGCRSFGSAAFLFFSAIILLLGRVYFVQPLSLWHKKTQDHRALSRFVRFHRLTAPVRDHRPKHVQQDNTTIYSSHAFQDSWLLPPWDGASHFSPRDAAKLAHRVAGTLGVTRSPQKKVLQEMAAHSRSPAGLLPCTRGLEHIQVSIQTMHAFQSGGNDTSLAYKIS